jgi:hypothetical protein
LSTPTNLLIMEAGGGYELLEKDEFFETSTVHEKAQSEQVVIISGKITISP